MVKYRGLDYSRIEIRECGDQIVIDTSKNMGDVEAEIAINNVLRVRWIDHAFDRLLDQAQLQ